MEIIEHVYRIAVVINIVVVHQMNDVFHGQRNAMEVTTDFIIFVMDRKKLFVVVF